jgi:hypothetical protein
MHYLARSHSRDHAAARWLVLLVVACGGGGSGGDDDAVDAAGGDDVPDARALPAGPGLEFALMPLQLLQPHAAGSEGMGPGGGLHASNRIFYAYPGLPYEIPVVAVGGAPPARDATVTLANAPAGMVAEPYVAASGAVQWRVVWNDPQATANDIVLTYTDRNGNVDTATWSITVGTSGWRFVDASAGANGSGTRESPFSAPGGSLANAEAGCDGGERLILRAGTYTLATDNPGGGAFLADIWEPDESCVIWLEYPGETVIIDGRYAEDGVDVPMLAVNFERSGAPPYFDSLTFRRFKDKAVYLGAGNGGYEYGFWRVLFDDIGPGTKGNNSAVVTFPQNYDHTARSRGYFVSNTFDHIDAIPIFKFYTVDYVANHGNLVDTCTESNEGFAYKSDVRFVSEVGNRTTANSDCAMTAGNQHDQVDRAFTGEIAFNNYQRVDADQHHCLRFNQDGATREVNVFNNTLRCRLGIHTAGGQRGPINFLRNVVVNSMSSESPWPYIDDLDDAGASSFVTQTDELFDADLDADGNLQGSDLADHGPSAPPEARRGHM